MIEACGPAHEILVLIAYSYGDALNMYVQLLSRTRGLKFGPRLHLLLYFEHVSSNGPGETAQMWRLHRCAVLPEPCLLANSIRTKILRVFVHLLNLHTYLYKIGHL